MKTKATILCCFLLIALLSYFTELTRSVSYTSAETGSRKGESYRLGFILVDSWESSSWIEIRARRMGVLPKKQTWIKTADTRETLVMTSRGHSKAPASYFLSSFETSPEEYSSVILNSFVKKFLLATEPEREELATQFFDHEYIP